MLLKKYKNIENNIIKYEKHIKNIFEDNYKKYLKKYKKLNIVEQNVLTNYNNDYFNINYYLVNNKINNYYLIKYIKEIKEETSTTTTSHKQIINLLDIYNKCINNLTNNINIVDKIINDFDINNKIILYKYIYKNDIYNETFINNFKETIKKIGNKILINSYESFFLDLSAFDGFKRQNGYMIEIDTNNFNYIYLEQNNILLPRNIEIEYIGCQKIHVNKNIVNNWNKYNKYGYHLYKDYIYKFKIINLHKINNEINKKSTINSTINLPLYILNNIYYMKEIDKPDWNSNEN
jgi:hypothetical protein